MNEITRALYGAWRLARLDPGGLAWFNDSVDGFWRSFFAAAIAAPGFALFVALRLAPLPVTAGPVRLVLIEVIAYVIGWVAFPLLMFYVARLIDRESRYIRFIVAANWAAVLQMALFVIVTGLARGFLPDAATAIIGAVVTGAILFYQWFIARTALSVPGVAAAGIVLMDLVVGVFVNNIASVMLLA
ncbi:MAG: hypothetical protein ACTSXZ_03015 [Alphaproteobacteria bacterium]